MSNNHGRKSAKEVVNEMVPKQKQKRGGHNRKHNYEAIAADYVAGMTVKQLCKKYNIKFPGTITSILNRMYVYKKKNEVILEEDDTVEELDKLTRHIGIY